MIPYLEPRKYRIIHNFNEFVYFIEYVNFYGEYGWYLTLGTQDFPFWDKGFVSANDCLEAFNHHYSNK